jgi:hypothetical protein
MKRKLAMMCSKTWPTIHNNEYTNHSTNAGH